MLEHTRFWYDGVDTKRVDFTRFLSTNFAILDMVTMPRKLKIKFVREVGLAATDSQSFMLSMNVFNPDFYIDQLMVKPEDFRVSALAVVNGLQVHEGCHVLYSGSCNPVKIMENTVAGRDRLNKACKLLVQVFQLVEDVFIEHAAVEAGVFGNEFIKDLNDVLLSEAVIKETMDRLEEATSKRIGKTREEMLNIVDIVKALGVAVRPENVSSLMRFEELVPYLEKLEEARRLHHKCTMGDRLDIVYALFDMLEEDPSFKRMAGMSGSETDPSRMRGIDGDKTQHPNQIVDGCSFEDEDSLEGVDPGDRAKLMEMLAAQEMKINANRGERVKSYERYVNEPIKIKYVEVSPTSGREFEIDSRFSTLGNVIRLKAEVNHAFGIPLDNGHVVRQRLSRIATDGLVMSRRHAVTVKRDKPQVILLLDWSGSMMGSLADSCKRGLAGMYESLSIAGVPVAAYAHTSSFEHGNEIAVLVGIAASGMPIGMGDVVYNGNWNQRFQGLDNVSLRENFDGHIIADVVKRFAGGSGQRVLVVFSDGRPSGPGYRGDDALKHTANTVKRVRESGIVVIGVSLTEGVVDANDAIYGKEFNVKAHRDLVGKFASIAQSVSEYHR